MFERYGDIQVIANLPIINNSNEATRMTFPEKQALLNKYAQIYAVYDSIAAFDVNGNLIVQSSGKTLPNHKDRNYFQQVIQTGQPVITNPETSKSTGEVVIHFAAPIKDVNTGKLIGVVRSRMPVKYVEAVAAGFGVDG